MNSNRADRDRDTPSAGKPGGLVQRILRSSYAQWFVSRIPGNLGIGVRARYYRLIAPRFGHTQILENVFVSGPENMSFGDGNTVERGSFIHAHDGELVVGNGCSFAQNVTLGASQGRILIGNDSAFGPNTVLRAGVHAFRKGELIKNQKHTRHTIVVGDDCWVASNVVISGDVTIGDGAVVGACSFVNRDVPPYTVVAGCPAVEIKKRK